MDTDDAALVAELRRLDAEAVARKLTVMEIPGGLGFMTKLRNSLPRLLDLADEAIRLREAVEKARATWMEPCDICCGTGKVLGAPCACGGSGKLADALKHARLCLIDVDKQIDEAVASVINDIEMQVVKDIAPGWVSIPAVEWEAIRARSAKGVS